MCSKFPSFKDLGKDCRDLFNNGYHIGLFHISVSNSTCHGMDIKTTGTHKTDDKSATADVEVKAAYPFMGLSSTHKWDLENTLDNEISIQNLIPGGKIGLKGKYNIDSGNKNGGAKINYQHRLFTVDANVDGGDDSSPVVGGSLVTGHGGITAGYRANYDTSSGELKANDIAVGFVTRDYSLLLAYDNLSILHGLYSHKISRELELGVQTQMLGGEEGPMLSVAGKFVFNGYGHTLRAKVDSKSKLGLGLELKAAQGLQAFASTDIDLKSFSGGNHKIGFGLDFGGYI